MLRPLQASPGHGRLHRAMTVRALQLWRIQRAPKAEAAAQALPLDTIFVRLDEWVGLVLSKFRLFTIFCSALATAADTALFQVVLERGSGYPVVICDRSNSFAVLSSFDHCLDLLGSKL